MGVKLHLYDVSKSLDESKNTFPNIDNLYTAPFCVNFVLICLLRYYCCLHFIYLIVDTLLWFRTKKYPFLVKS